MLPHCVILPVCSAVLRISIISDCSEVVSSPSPGFLVHCTIWSASLSNADMAMHVKVHEPCVTNCILTLGFQAGICMLPTCTISKFGEMVNILQSKTIWQYALRVRF